MKLMNYCSGIQHIGIPTSDIEASRAFYTGLGFEVVHDRIIRDGTQHVIFLQSGNLMLEVYEDVTAGKSGAIDHFAIDCSDIETAFDDAVKSGYKIVSDDIEELPFWKNGVRFFIIEGPDRERVEFNQVLPEKYSDR